MFPCWAPLKSLSASATSHFLASLTYLCAFLARKVVSTVDEVQLKKLLLKTGLEKQSSICRLSIWVWQSGLTGSVPFLPWPWSCRYTAKRNKSHIGKSFTWLNSLCQGCYISTATRPGKEGATLRAHAEKNGGDAPGGFKHAVIYAQEPLNKILVHACMQFGHV